jgi:hypothetical protein
MLKVLVDTAVTSTISSRAVSGLITIVNISGDVTVTPPSNDAPLTTVIEVSAELILEARVVC